MVSFQRPTGAAADLRELEYVSALQQTQEGGVVRKDGSIQALDIQLFLKSRYGMQVSLEDVQRTIVQDFGGDGFIDLSEITALLLVPTIKKAAFSSQADDRPSNIVIPESGLIQTVLDMILRDVRGSSEPPELSISLLQDILLAYGEKEMSNDTSLLTEMMEVAGNGEGDRFDVKAFSRALTHDIALYDEKDEATLDTNYRDVMKKPADPAQDAITDDDDLNLQEHQESDDNDNDYNRVENGNNKNDSTVPVKARKFPSSPAIDFTACRYSSKYIVVFLWTGFVISYIAYFGQFIQEQTSWYFYNFCPQNGFGCRIALAILQWLFILATLCAFGLAYVALGSIGNGIEDTRKWTRFIAMCVVGTFTWAFFMLVYRQEDESIGTVTYFDENGDVISQQDVILDESENYESVVYFLSLILGNAVLLLQLWMMFGDTIRRRCMGKASKWLIRWCTSSGIKAEAGNKQAAALKMKSLVENACKVHAVSEKDNDRGETSFGAGLLNFSVMGETFEEAGGFLWTWKRLFSKELFEKDGIWISARLLSGNFSQLLISAFVLTYGIAFTSVVVEEWERGKADPSRYLYLTLEWFNVFVPEQDFAESTCAFVTDLANGALNVSSVVLLSADNFTCTTIAEEAINRTMQRVAESLYPQEQYMVKVPMVIATAVAFTCTLALVVVYIPSVASTTLQFRTGVIPFFRDEYNFDLYRSRLDQVTILLGSMFWSALYAAGFIGVLVGVIVFLFLWQATSQFFVNLMAVLIALICTIGIKMLIAVFLLRTAYAAFYRKKVNQVNIVSLALESIMVGFAIGTALARAFKLVLIAALYIGRIDTPLLSPGVGVGPLMDRYPFIFRQDILALEAHRHPYIDLIGKMYLLKLRYQERFVNRTGYCYRLIFTVALLPWLRKYRVIARPDLGDTDSAAPDGSLLRSTILPRSSILYQSGRRGLSIATGSFIDSAALLTESGDGFEADKHPKNFEKSR